MEVSIELKEINIKNHTCYYFDDIININGLDLDNILLDETTHQNTLTYDFGCKTPYGAKPLRIIFQLLIFNPWKSPWNWIAFSWNSFFYYLAWLDATLDALQARPLHQILLFLRNNSLAV